MRMWSVTPAALDAKALVACWRESLLAQAVLLGKTKGYIHHPQLTRFRESDNPTVSIATFLATLADEADVRGYHFNRRLIVEDPSKSLLIDVTDKQIEYEWNLLLLKESHRDSAAYEKMKAMPMNSNPMFHIIQGPIATWEHVLDALKP